MAVTRSDVVIIEQVNAAHRLGVPVSVQWSDGRRWHVIDAVVTQAKRDGTLSAFTDREISGAKWWGWPEAVQETLRSVAAQARSVILVALDGEAQVLCERPSVDVLLAVGALPIQPEALLTIEEIRESFAKTRSADMVLRTAAELGLDELGRGSTHA